MNLDGLYRMQGMLFSLMILGAFLKKKGIITDEGKRVIADLVIFVTLPCSIIESFEVELSMDILKSSAQALLVSCMVQVACYILNMVLYPVWERKRRRSSNTRRWRPMPGFWEIRWRRASSARWGFSTPLFT